LKAKKTFSVLR